MKIRPYRFARPARGIAVFLVTGLIIAGWAAFAPGLAEETETRSKGDPIRITADKLVTDNAERSAQFTGNVKAVQGDTVITADRLTIFYKSGGASSATPSGDSIEKLEAHGKVRIEFDNRVAVSNQAVYIIAERKLVLSGPGSKVISGQDEVSGSKITFFRDDGRVSLEGDDQNRVNAIIHSDQGGLN